MNVPNLLTYQNYGDLKSLLSKLFKHINKMLTIIIMVIIYFDNLLIIIILKIMIISFFFFQQSFPNTTI